jgi:hypothetical protein
VKKCIFSRDTPEDVFWRGTIGYRINSRVYLMLPKKIITVAAIASVLSVGIAREASAVPPPYKFEWRNLEVVCTELTEMEIPDVVYTCKSNPKIVASCLKEKGEVGLIGSRLFCRLPLSQKIDAGLIPQGNLKLRLPPPGGDLGQIPPYIPTEFETREFKVIPPPLKSEPTRPSIPKELKVIPPPLTNSTIPTIPKAN